MGWEHWDGVPSGYSSTRMSATIVGPLLWGSTRMGLLGWAATRMGCHRDGLPLG